MAIKMDRNILETEIGYFLNETAEKGVILSVSTAGSGIALENPANLATVSASSSGQKPLGGLLTDFVNYDLTKQPLNWHKDQAQIGDKACIMTKGWFVTNKVIGTPTANGTAVLSSSGNVTIKAAAASYNEVANPFVGYFRSILDADGYAKVYIDL